MPPRSSHRFPPSIEPMPPQQNPMRLWSFAQRSLQLQRQQRILLRIFENRHQLPVLMRIHASKRLQQLVTLQRHSPSRSKPIRKQRVPHRMHMKDSPSPRPVSINHPMQRSLRRRPARPSQNIAVSIDLQQILRRNRALIQPASRNKYPPRLSITKTEVPRSRRNPSPPRALVSRPAKRLSPLQQRIIPNHRSHSRARTSP